MVAKWLTGLPRTSGVGGSSMCPVCAELELLPMIWGFPLVSPKTCIACDFKIVHSARAILPYNRAVHTIVRAIVCTIIRDNFCYRKLKALFQI